MKYLVLFLCSILSILQNAQSHTIWEIGKMDKSPMEFCLAPDKYPDFVKQDFGWEDKYYIVGFSTPTKNWPYIMPGQIDSWGGTAGLSGWRPPYLNILFNLNKFTSNASAQLILNFVAISKNNPPLVKISVNGVSWDYQFPKGISEKPIFSPKNILPYQISIPLPPQLLKKDGNIITIHPLLGSWSMFDYIALKSDSLMTIDIPTSYFIKNISPATYEIEQNKKRIQPLIIEVLHLKDEPLLEVFIDKALSFSQKIEAGEYHFEVPMSAVSQKKQTHYSIRINKKIIKEGLISQNPQKIRTLAQYVDTKIGTAHSRWMIAPGPWMPMGMVKFSPDNQNSGWQAGYQPSFENIAGFSHIHEFSMSGLLVMPTNGSLIIKPGDQADPDSGYRSRIDKKTEKAPIGSYSVKLTDYNIDVDITATNRASFGKYTFPKNIPNSRILIDLDVRAEYNFLLDEAYIKKINDSTIEGYSYQRSPNIWSEIHYRKDYVEEEFLKVGDSSEQKYKVHFVIEFDSPIKKMGFWKDTIIESGTILQTKNIQKVGAFIEFDTQQKNTIQMRTAISYVSIANAALNLKTEITDIFGWNFEQIKLAQIKAWDNIFNLIKINTNDSREKTRFYNNLYRSYCRNTFSDVDGSWVDANENIQKLNNPKRVMLGGDGFWNAFWNLFPLWNMISPELSSNWVHSELAMYDIHGWLARAPAGLEYLPIMVAEQEIALIVSAYQMGIRDFDVQKAFTATHKMQTTTATYIGGGYAGNRDLPQYLKYKYVPFHKGRTSNTMEYAFEDWGISQFAKSLGKENFYTEFLERSTWWKNIIDPETKFARMRYADGTWFTPFDPITTAGDVQFVEGNGWQITFWVPHDIPGLIKLIGKDTLVNRLQKGFMDSKPWRYNALNEKYWDLQVVQGNQQTMHFSFIFNWAGSPWLTQKWNRSLLDRYYGYGEANAYLGDEDQGQMSAWFVLSAIGLFQIDGGTRSEPIYEIGSPIFEKIEINLNNKYKRGSTFVIEAKNTSRKNIYVQNAILNGKKLDNFWFPASELLKGGKLILQMGNKPNKKWGIKNLP